jgi:hypothetical protein
MQSDILRFTEAPITDDGIEKYECHEHEPENGTNLNNAGEIRINIGTQDLFTHPAGSYLLFEGRLTKADGTAYANDAIVALTHNGIMHLFSQISYKLADKDIESVNHPGQATTMLGMLKYPNDFQLAQGLNQLWYKDTATAAHLTNNAGFGVRQQYLIQKPTTKGTFSFIIPLKHIFGYCEDYDKIVYGVKHTLTLVRRSDDDAIFRDNAAGAGKVRLSKLSWFMPEVIPSDLEKMQLYKTIESKALLTVAYRARQCESVSVPGTTTFSWPLGSQAAPEKPRYIIVGFQTEKDGDQLKNPSIFDHCNVKNIYVELNTNRYPAVDYQLSFPNQQISRAYRDAATFSEKFYGMDELITQSNITPSDYKDLYPLMVFDVSKQSEKLKASTVDIKIKATFNENVPAGTQAFAVVISDKMLKLQSDGNKMHVV